MWQTGPYIQQSWAAHKSVFDYVICVKTWVYSGLLGFRRDFNHPRCIQINGDYPWMNTYSFQTNHRAFDTTHVFMWLELLRWPGCRHVGRVPEGKFFFGCIEPCVFKCRSVKQRLGLQCTMFTRLAVKPLMTLMRIKINMSSLLYTKYKSRKCLGHESGITLLWQISTLLSTYLWRNIFVWAKCDTVTLLVLQVWHTEGVRGFFRGVPKLAWFWWTFGPCGKCQQWSSCIKFTYSNYI